MFNRLSREIQGLYECPADKQLPSVYITIISCLHLHGCCNEKAGLTCANMITELWNARFKPRGKSVMYLFVLVTEALLHNGRQPRSTASSSGVLGCHRYGNVFLDGCVVSLRWLSCLASNFKWGRDVWLSLIWHIHRYECFALLASLSNSAEGGYDE